MSDEEHRIYNNSVVQYNGSTGTNNDSIWSVTITTCASDLPVCYEPIDLCETCAYKETCKKSKNPKYKISSSST